MPMRTCRFVASSSTLSSWRPTSCTPTPRRRPRLGAGRRPSRAHADEAGPLRRELADLAELAADVVHAYTAQAATSGVGLVTEIGAPAHTNADKDLLREAVANLVDNAVRVSPRGGDVRLRVDRGAAGPMIAVADSGPGIEEDGRPGLC